MTLIPLDLRANVLLTERFLTTLKGLRTSTNIMRVLRYRSYDIKVICNLIYIIYVGSMTSLVVCTNDGLCGQ